MDYVNASHGHSQGGGLRSRGGTPVAMRRELAPYSRVRGGARYTQVAAGRKRKRSIALGVIIALVAAVVVGASVAAASAIGFINSIGSRLNEGVTEEIKAVLADQEATAMSLASEWTDTTPFYMLVLGIDSDESRMYGDESDLYGTSDSSYRSDTIILVRIDPGEKKITMVSILRDTQVTIDGVQQKINAAYALGGVSKAIEVVSEFAGVPITHFATVNIDGLVAIVDALGGIEVNVPYEIDDWYTGWYLAAGLQTLTGEQAMILARSRHAYDDMGSGDRYRSAHQRLLIAAIIEKLMSSSPATMVETISILADYVTTDFTVDEIISLALAMYGIDIDNDVYSTANPTTSVYENSLWYEISDDEAWQAIMAQVDAGEKPDTDSGYVSVTDDINNAEHGEDAATVEETTVVVRDASGGTASTSDVVATLQANGWTAEDGGVANTTVEETVVVYDSITQADNAQAIADLLGVSCEAAGTTWSVSGDITVVLGTG